MPLDSDSLYDFILQNPLHFAGFKSREDRMPTEEMALKSRGHKKALGTEEILALKKKKYTSEA